MWYYIYIYIYIYYIIVYLFYLFFLIQTGATTSARWVEDCRHKPFFSGKQSLLFACLSIMHPPFSRFGPTKDPLISYQKLSRRSTDFCNELAQTDKVLAKIQDSNGTPKKTLGNFYQNWPKLRTLPYIAPKTLGSYSLGAARIRTLSSTSQKNFRCRFSSSSWTRVRMARLGQPQHLVL